LIARRRHGERSRRDGQGVGTGCWGVLKVHWGCSTGAQGVLQGCAGVIYNPNEYVMAADWSCFRRCVELSWTGISFTDDTMINNEPITSLIARLGIFRQNLECGIRFQLLVPPFVLKSLLPSIPSILMVSEHVDKVSLLESGFPRILLFRFLFEPCPTWTDMDLPFLSSCNVSFPKEHYHEAFIFLSSADAVIKCSGSDIVSFQFKNSNTPITDNMVDAEATKCLAAGYNVYRIIVNTAGNVHDADYTKSVEGVTVVVLSKSSVEIFLGQNCVSNFSSSSAIIVDLA
jgi:hypothetical protein